MQSSFKSAPFSPDFYTLSPFYFRGDGGGRNQSVFADLVEIEQQPVNEFHQDDAVDLSPRFMFSSKPGNVTVASSNLHYATLNTGVSLGYRERVEGERGCLDTGEIMYQKAPTTGAEATLVNGNNSLENWGDSGMGDNSQHTDTSTDIDTDDRNQYQGAQPGVLVPIDSSDLSKAKSGDQKTLRRLAQNREAARKSRLRKKAYVQQLENSRARLAQLEDELQRARQQKNIRSDQRKTVNTLSQGFFVANSGVSGDQGHSIPGNGALVFDTEYTRWLDDHQRLINELRSAVNSHLSDNELRVMVDGVMAHYDEIFRLKSIAAKTDVFHMLSGMWKTPAERFFMWLGGFKSSELLKMLGNHLDPLTDQQLLGICNLQQSSQQAEDALSQGMEALQQSLLETLSTSSLGPSVSANVADYMGQMAIAMGKLATLENFLHQADLLRQQTLQQMHRILTTRQAARAFLVINDYMSRLRALSSLWLARPRD